ncbi:MAG TPA: DUF6036 family nucleotidyltransferase [Terriglobales bacterium]|nr:DUF6036 family nucleotidyltransferase [Terriglobales bacterium]
MYCVGGFAVTVVYGAARTTADLDVLWTTHNVGASATLSLAERGSELHRRFGVYIDRVGVVAPPCNFASRLLEIFPGAFERLRLFVPDAYDLALLKLERNVQRDRDDVKWLARTTPFELAVLRRRYMEEQREYLVGPVERHDLTLQLWIDMIEEDRRSGPSGKI